MRDLKTIDTELALLVSRAVVDPRARRELGDRQVDELLDEQMNANAHSCTANLAW